MTTLTNKERELVAIGAAIGSNCRPCIVAHVREARNSGLGDAQITEAVELAQKVKQVPADRVLEAAYAQLGREPSERRPDAPTEPQTCGC